MINRRIKYTAKGIKKQVLTWNSQPYTPVGFTASRPG
jgi:hypothetical protein